MIDPKKLLFSQPTLCDPFPAVDASSKPDGFRSLHEDDWRQIEFVALANHAHINEQLAALAAFKQQHRSGPGWTSVYIRQEHPTPLAKVGVRFKDLPALPFAALAIGAGPTWSGMVKGGFALSDVGDSFIYGQRSTDGQVFQLAVSPSNSSQQFAQALSLLTSKSGLLLLDWQAVVIVDTSSSESAMTWAHRYQRT